jgi:hypothetical protein
MEYHLEITIARETHERASGFGQVSHSPGALLSREVVFLHFESRIINPSSENEHILSGTRQKRISPPGTKLLTKDTWQDNVRMKARFHSYMPSVGTSIEAASQ